MSTRFTNPGLEGNPHFVDLLSFEAPIDEQVAATLALAYEQRTANLIAFHASQTLPAGHPILSIIAGRMGL